MNLDAARRPFLFLFVFVLFFVATIIVLQLYQVSFSWTRGTSGEIVSLGIVIFGVMLSIIKENCLYMAVAAIIALALYNAQNIINAVNSFSAGMV